jgi:hypothetical protein
VFESLQTALLIHGYYILGVKNFGESVSGLAIPMFVENSSGLDS